MYYRHSGSGVTWYMCATKYIFVGDYAAITAWRWEFSGPSTTWHTHYNSVNISALLLHVDVVLSSLLSKNTTIKIFPLVLCGCDTQSPTLREETKLMVFESRALMKIFGCQGGVNSTRMDKIARWGSSWFVHRPNIIRVIKSVRIEMDGACGMHRQRRERHTGLWLGKEPFGRPKPRWEGKLKMDHRGGVDWTGLAQDRDKWWDAVNTIWKFLFCKVLRISLLAEELQASLEGLQILCGSPLLQLTLQSLF